MLREDFMVNVKNTVMLGLIWLLALSVSAQANEEDYLSVSSVGRGAKLVLNNDLLIPANKSDVSMREVTRAYQFVAVCEVNIRESSRDLRVLKTGHEIVFSGQVTEGDKGTWHFHQLEVSKPEAVKSVTCYAEKLDTAGRWHPTAAVIWDLKASFEGAASLVLAEPVEIPN